MGAQMTTPAGLFANVEIIARDARGRFVSRQRVKNKIVLNGRNLVRDLLGGLQRWPTHMAIGTGTNAVTDGDSQLQTQVYQDLITRRVQMSSGIKFQLFVPTGSANGNTITEAGVQQVLGSNTVLFSRVLLSTPVVKTIAVSLTVSWSITIASS